MIQIIIFSFVAYAVKSSDLELSTAFHCIESVSKLLTCSLSLAIYDFSFLR